MLKRKSMYNLLSISSFRLITIVFGLIIPRFFLLNYGSELNGLISSINNIYAYLVIFEAGIGAAAIQSLYHPLANNDKIKVSAIINATNKYYKKIGLIIGFSIIIISLLYPLLVSLSIPFFKLVTLIIIMGIPLFLDFIVQAKFRVLLTAENKLYVINNINVIITTISYLSKLFLIFLNVDIIFIQLIFTITSITKILLIFLYFKAKYRNFLDAGVEPDYIAISKSKYSAIHHFTYVVFNNIDILVITIFLDLRLVSVYVIYKMIFDNVSLIPSSLITSFKNGFGQIYSNNSERFKSLYDFFEVIYTSLVFSFFTITLLLIIPFLRLYTNGVNDINYMLPMFAFYMFLASLLENLKTLSLNIVFIAGHFQETSYSAYIEVLLNIVLSIGLAIFLGLNGVLLATVISILYRILFLTEYTNRHIMHKKSSIIYKRWIRSVLITIIIFVIFRALSIEISSYLIFIFVGFILTLFVNSIFLIINILFEKNSRFFSNYYLNYAVQWLKRISGK